MASLFSLRSSLLVVALAASGCGTYLKPYALREARPAPPTAAAAELKNLPAPREKVVVAVYRFRDQTGQYRVLENSSTFSTAVTQGATSILVRALEDSGWFVSIEREALPNLLNERQIITQIRNQNAGPDGQPLGPLPPLLYAGVLLEGGIIGYDTNVITSGVGVRYFGTGGSGQIRQDQVTIYLRAISTQTGRVLKTVHTTKTILSQRVDGGLFRYVALQRLLETEAGYSFNEPPVLAVTEAIEEAVRGLVIEGVRENLWSLSNPNDIYSPAFVAYDEDVANAAETDVFGRDVSEKRRGFSLGGSVAATLYEGDYMNAIAAPAADLSLRRSVSPHLALGVSIAAGEIAADQAFRTRHLAAEANGMYYLLPNSRVTPFLQAGAGVLVQPDRTGPGRTTYPYVTGEAGFDMLVSPSVSLGISAGNLYPVFEGLDGVVRGSVHDNFFLFKSRLVYYM